MLCSIVTRCYPETPSITTSNASRSPRGVRAVCRSLIGANTPVLTPLRGYSLIIIPLDLSRQCRGGGSTHSLAGVAREAISLHVARVTTAFGNFLGSLTLSESTPSTLATLRLQRSSQLLCLRRTQTRTTYFPRMASTSAEKPEGDAQTSPGSEMSATTQNASPLTMQIVVRKDLLEASANERLSV